MKNVAQDLDLTVELQHKKINISNSRVGLPCFFTLDIAAKQRIKFSTILKLLTIATIGHCLRSTWILVFKLKMILSLNLCVDCDTIIFMRSVFIVFHHEICTYCNMRNSSSVRACVCFRERGITCVNYCR